MPLLRLLRADVRACCGALVLVLATILPAHADPAAALAALRAGGHVALMRHAAAPGGAGDPPEFRLDDCATQRNLSAKGRSQAVAIGKRLKAEGIAITRVISSPWCRCVDTARLLDVGAVAVEAAFSNAFMLRERHDELARGAKAFIAAWNRAGTLLVVTHGSNIQGLVGINPGEGEIVVVAPGDPLVVVGRIAPPRS